MNTFLTRRWLKNLPVAVFVVGGGIAIAQSQTGEAVFPYVGYLEENGFAVTGERTVRVDLFATANAAESPCRSQTFSPVDLHAGRFQVEVTVPRAGGVYDACLAGGEMFAGIAVGAADAAAGDLVALTSGLGGDRVRIGTVPFAAASPKAVPLLVADSVQVNGDVLAGGTVSANSAAINGALTANSAAITGALTANSVSVAAALSAANLTATNVNATGQYRGDGKPLFVFCRELTNIGAGGEGEFATTTRQTILRLDPTRPSTSKCVPAVTSGAGYVGVVASVITHGGNTLSADRNFRGALPVMDSDGTPLAFAYVEGRTTDIPDRAIFLDLLFVYVGDLVP
jgi:hypothetical protein